MVFSTYHFILLFLPLVLGAYYLAHVLRLRVTRALVLTLFSYAFYGWDRPGFIGLMLVTTVLDWFCGKIVAQKEHRWRRSSGPATSMACAPYFDVGSQEVDVPRLRLPPVDHGMFR